VRRIFTDSIQQTISHLLPRELRHTVVVQALVATNNTDYIQVASHGHISLDSFPFGGCNTVMDHVYLGIPIVTRVGDLWRNRIGAAILTRVGLGDLVAYSEAEYTDLAVQLLSNSSLLSQTRARVHAADMAPIFSTVEADAYVPLFKWFANADQFPSVLGGEPWTAEELEGCVRMERSRLLRGSGHAPQDVNAASLAAGNHCRALSIEGKLHPFRGQRNGYGGPLREGNPILATTITADWL